MDTKIILVGIVVVLFVVSMHKAQAAGRGNHEQTRLSVSEKHTQWMERHGRVYKDELEKGKRLKIFKENLEFIESVNSAGNMSYKLGINEFADITSEEFFTKYTGLKMPSHPPMATEFKINNELTDDMPSKLDWREKGAVTQVKYQGQCGCCWAFSAIAALEGAYQIATGQLVELSEQQVLDCTTKDSYGCNGGLMTSAFEFIIENGGISTESVYPYEMQQGTCRSQGVSPTVQISSYNVVPQSETDLMQAVTQQPVSIGISTSGEFQFYRGGTYHGTCGDQINHAVTAIGYGIDEQGQNYWLLKNSWGTTWGENGFMKIIKDTGNSGGFCDITKLSSYPVIN